MRTTSGVLALPAGTFFVRVRGASAGSYTFAVGERHDSGVLYDIRGPVSARAAALEAEGHRILKLNIGNPPPFGFDAPD